jgi:AraC-like DNA-binding protein
MNDRSPARLSVIHMLPDHLLAQGIDPARVFARAGISWAPEGLPTAPVARAQIFSALEEAARLLGDPLVGPVLAARADPGRLGVAGLALFSGLTVRDCLLAHARFIPTMLSGVRPALSQSNGRACWQLRFGRDAEHARFMSEGAIAFVVEAMRHMLGGEAFAFELGFPHRARHAPRLFEDHFQSSVRFDAGAASVLSFDAGLLDRANACLGRWPAGIPGPAQAENGGEGGLAGEDLVPVVGRIVDGMMMAGEVSLVRAARTLGYPPRSLQRQLALCATSFEELTEIRRRAAARRLLSDSTLGVGTIAQALAYSHPAHFIRAFERWEGVSPTRWRRGMAELPSPSPSRGG